MHSVPPAAKTVHQVCHARSSIKGSFQKQLNPLVEQTLAGWRHGGRPVMPTFREEAMVAVIARARFQNHGHSAGRRQHLEVPGSGENRPRARK